MRVVIGDGISLERLIASESGYCLSVEQEDGCRRITAGAIHFGMKSDSYAELTEQATEVHVVMRRSVQGLGLVREARRLAADAGLSPVLWIVGGAFPYGSGVMDPVSYEGSGALWACEEGVLRDGGTVLRIPVPLDIGERYSRQLLRHLISAPTSCAPAVFDAAPARMVFDAGMNFAGRGSVHHVSVSAPLSVEAVRRHLGLKPQDDGGLLSRFFGRDECTAFSSVVRIPSGRKGALSRNRVLSALEEMMEALHR